MAYYSNSPVVHNGPPTHPALHVRDAKDAHVVLEAVRLNMLPLIKRRLTASEREQLSSGNVFVWEEAENDGGLLRWTDGRRWSQSRMRGDYLFYEEKMETTQEEKDAKAAIRALRTTDPLAVAPPTNRRKDRPNRPNGLTKQTYSALVYLPGSSLPRKWHVVAYFTGDDYVRLPVIESYDYLRNLRVPGGIFVSSKANGSRTDRFSYTTDGIEPYNSASHGHGHPSQYSMLQGVPRGPMSPASSSSSIPLSPTQHHSRPLPSSGAAMGPGRAETSLPSISILTGLQDTPESRQPHSSPSVQLGHPSPTTYSPLSAEDRRVLNSFKVVL
ncbi:Gti1/Pac2 family-domain-containing protein [Suillus subalutaceus]|uniref:Gti1/Pac2 family-domain-containing protein n=1 Tax=Suillus subalutaceus TaxID=48586 RepID=UPI001B884A7A|nr:Gti1/Pac2 family-domain-containing protein [Suillus subalutaceus]KAG1847205.1 Gti1/Pac2 family-domain-containing protein [Suillus subalutaceus]